MKKLFFLLVFFSINLFVNAQAPDIVVDWGPVMKAKEVDFDRIVGTYDGNFYTFGTPTHTGMFRTVSALLSKREYNVSCYGMKDHRLKYKKVMEDFEYKGKNAVFQKAMITPKGEVVMYFVAFNGKDDKKYLITRTMDADGRFSKPEVLTTIDTKRRSEGDFQIQTSKDSTLLMIYIDPPYERKEDEKFEVLVMDRDHKLLWEKSVVLPYTDKYFSVKDVTITNKGDIFVLGFSEPDKKKGEKRKRKASNEDWKLYRLAQGEESITEYDLDLDDQFVKSASIASDFGDGKMAIAGFYTDDRRGGVGGSFFYTIDQQSLEPVTTSLQEFDKTFLANFMSERRAEKGKDLYNFRFRDFIRRSDGGAIVVAEQYYVVVTTTTSANGVTTTNYTYHYNDLIVLNINPDGNIEWASHVPKQQVSSNDGGYYSSYLLIVEKERLHFIYNDHRKNADRLARGKKIKTMGNVRKAMAVISTVEADGSVVYDQLFRNKDFDAVLVPKKSHQAERTEVLMVGEKGSKCRFGTLKFQ